MTGPSDRRLDPSDWFSVEGVAAATRGGNRGDDLGDGLVADQGLLRLPGLSRASLPDLRRHRRTERSERKSTVWRNMRSCATKQAPRNLVTRRVMMRRRGAVR